MPFALVMTVNLFELNENCVLKQKNKMKLKVWDFNRNSLGRMVGVQHSMQNRLNAVRTEWKYQNNKQFYAANDFSPNSLNCHG